MRKEKKFDKSTWERMGMELCTLRELITEIRCDSDYQNAMDFATWDKLDKVIASIDRIRSDAEVRMYKFVKPEITDDYFYPNTIPERNKKISEVVKAYRNSFIKKEIN